MLPKAVLHHLFLAISLAITSLWATNPGNNVAFSSKFLEAQTLVFGFGEVVAARVVGAMSALAIKDIQHDVLQFVYDSAGMGSGEAGEEFDGGEFESEEFHRWEFEGRGFYGGDRQIPAYDDPAVRFDEGDSEDFTRGEIIFVFSALIGLCAIFRSIIRWLARRFTTAADASEDPDPDPSEPPDESIEAAQGRMSQEPAASGDADAVLAVTPDADIDDGTASSDDLALPALAPVDMSARCTSQEPTAASDADAVLAVTPDADIDDATASLDDRALPAPTFVDASAIDSSSVEGSVAMVKADAVPTVAPATEMDVSVAVEVLAPPASAPVDTSATTALVSDATIPTASAIKVHAATPANVAIPAVVAPSEYLSAEEFLAAHKAAHWNVTANGKFRWDKGMPHYGLGPRCASAKSGANLKALERLAGIERPFFFPFMADLDGIATSVRTRIPHYIGPDNLLYAVAINGNAWIDHTGPPDGCAILPRPRKPANP
ncbi:hypothetical protein FIBSPDRAFT_378140 [Athelia psychrophila]|uniref:Uncharacterized protein n=1 Tax=Athelia psychrophila TaxID=1759441 RepID=A0A166W201_9AGAM|nr:hypothetical protein FIBSPDRAFT_378140 [Fibularhizoctonia sp. CBS 109695]